jgi:hypothetical protein
MRSDLEQFGLSEPRETDRRSGKSHLAASTTRNCGAPETHRSIGDRFCRGDSADSDDRHHEKIVAPENGLHGREKKG